LLKRAFNRLQIAGVPPARSVRPRQEVRVRATAMDGLRCQREVFAGNQAAVAQDGRAFEDVA
jgi:hypothetical protein